MRLEDLMLFVKVAELRSFTAASKVLALPKSTISRRLADLEEQLGVKLLHRSTRKVALTDAGTTYLESCVKALETIEGAGQSIREAQSEPSGRLVVTAPHLFGTTYVVPVVHEYLRLYPKVDVTMELSQDFLDLVTHGIDVAFRMGPVRDPNLVIRKLGKGGLLYCASTEYLRRRGTPRTPGDLAEHDCVVLDTQKHGVRWSFAAPEGEFSLPIRSRLSVNNSHACFDSVRAGMGIGRLPRFLIAPEVAAGRLEFILAEWTPAPSMVSLVYPGHSGGKRVKSFVELAARRLPAMLDEMPT